MLVIDDFAHHPTAVRETLAALRATVAKGGRLLVAFEPRSATSRRRIFQKDYVSAFSNADLTWIAVPYNQSSIPEADLFSSQQLVEDLKATGKQAAVFGDVSRWVEEVCRIAAPGDTIAILSNGGFGGFVQKTLDDLKTRQLAAEGNAS